VLGDAGNVADGICPGVLGDDWDLQADENIRTVKIT
jgi:hypothetical protein